MGSIVKASRQLGIAEANIYNWKKKMERSNLPSLKRPEEHEILALEVKRLRQENAELKKVNEILKGAAAFFSQNHLK